MRFRFGPLILVLVSLLETFSSARADDLDDFLAAQMRWQQIPGLSLAVIKAGTLVKAQGYGFANLETQTPTTAETAFKLGSLSKQFLASAILVLVQDGKLELDAPVAKYLPDTPPPWQAITVRHLLTHTSGLPREFPAFDPFKPQAEADTLKIAAALPLRFAPGEKWEYSNIGYSVLAEIIRSVSGQPWSEFVAAHLFTPAGMSATRTTTSNLVPHRASGYTGRGRELQNAPDWPVVRPSGAFLSTVLDLAKWDAVLGSDMILDGASRAALWTPVTLNHGASHPYGFGWFIDAANGHRRIHHDGGLPGFVADFERFPDDALSIIVLANRDNRDLRDLALRVAAFYAPALSPPEEKPILDAEPRVTAQIESILTGFADGRPILEPFTPKLGQALRTEMNAGLSEKLHELGALPPLQLLERKEEAGERVYRYRANYRYVPLFVRCAFDAENKITKFALSD